jgi:transposase
VQEVRFQLHHPDGHQATATIEKSTAGASLLAQVIVAKVADHLPLHRQERMFERHGVDISRKTMGGWLAQCAHLLDPCMDR